MSPELALALPTTRDEEWRYADSAAIARLTPDDLAAWKDVTLAAGETRRHAMVVGGSSPELHRIRLTLAPGARGELFVVVVGDDYTRVECEVVLGQGAHFELGGVTIGGGDATREIVTRVRHAGQGSTSHQVVRSVHWAQATGNFLGRIEVAREGQQTDAAQDFKGLLLTRGASANARPELEIFADDVKCAHGASIGQLDEAARFYMAARGISPDAAKALLVQAFIADALAALDDDGERERLFAVALASLESAAL